MNGVLTARQSIAVCPVEKRKWVLPGFYISPSFDRIARPFLDKSPNYHVLAEGIRNVLNSRQEILPEKFARFCKAAYGMQTIDNEDMQRLGIALIADYDMRQRTPLTVIDVYESALQCPKSKLTLMAECLSAVYCNDRNLRFQKNPNRLLDELVRYLKADAQFLPRMMLDYIFAYGKSSCEQSKRLFKESLAAKILIKTEATIGNRNVPIYIKGILSVDNLLAYAPSENSLIYINEINYSKISYEFKDKTREIKTRQFSHDDLKIEIELADMANKEIETRLFSEN